MIAAECRPRFESIQYESSQKKLCQTRLGPETHVENTTAQSVLVCRLALCSWSTIGKLSANIADHEVDIMEVGGYMHDLYQTEPKRGVPLDDFLPGGSDAGVWSYEEVSTRDAVARKIVRGFQIAHMRETQVRWRFVATEIRTEFRVTLRRTASCPNDRGEHVRVRRVWDIRKALLNADLDTFFTCIPESMFQLGHCWLLLHGARLRRCGEKRFARYGLRTTANAS